MLRRAAASSRVLLLITAIARWPPLGARAAQLAAEGRETKQATSAASVLVRHASASAKANAVRAMITLARSESPIAAAASTFDRDPWAINLETERWICALACCARTVKRT